MGTKSSQYLYCIWPFQVRMIHCQILPRHIICDTGTNIAQWWRLTHLVYSTVAEVVEVQVVKVGIVVIAVARINLSSPTSQHTKDDFLSKLTY